MLHRRVVRGAHLTEGDEMPRTTHRSTSGTKLYAKRNKTGEFTDIQTYARAHGQDVKRSSAAERATAKATAAKKSTKKKSVKKSAKKKSVKKKAAKHGAK